MSQWMTPNQPIQKQNWIHKTDAKLMQKSLRKHQRTVQDCNPASQCVYYPLGLHDIFHAIVMRISSVKPVLWLAVNLHPLLSDGAAFNTHSRSSLTSYPISRSLLNCFLFSELRLCVLNTAPFENRWWRFTANHRTVFTDEMRMTIACKISCSPTIHPICSK